MTHDDDDNQRSRSSIDMSQMLTNVIMQNTLLKMCNSDSKEQSMSKYDLTIFERKEITPAVMEQYIIKYNNNTDIIFSKMENEIPDKKTEEEL